MADDPLEDAFDLDKVPRPDADLAEPELPEPDITPPEIELDVEPPELPEPDITPPDIELELESGPIEPLLPPELAGAGPQDDTLPFPVDDPADKAEQGGGGEAENELTGIAAQMLVLLEGFNDKLDEMNEKLDSIGTFGP